MTMMSTEILKSILVLFSLSELVGCTQACPTRRCLANEITAKAVYSPPQNSDCDVNVNLTFIQYQTLSVDMKDLHFSSVLKILMEWRDSELAWTDSQYSFKELTLSADQIWTPNLTVSNAVYTAMKPVSNDILVRSDGAVKYAVSMYVTVVCGINLFTYPFVSDACPVIISGRNDSVCGLNLKFGKISSVGGDEGEWKTTAVNLHQEKGNYLHVYLSSNPFNGVISLVLPSVLIMVVDLVSFALPLDGGERNPFKIKLVFSFTMYLLLLCKHVPNSGPCSPLLYFHYCYCLIALVASVLISMMLTRLAKNGSLWPCRPCRSARAKVHPEDMSKKRANLNISDGLKTSTKLIRKEAAMQNISHFLENMDEEESEKQRRHTYANYWDKIVFWAYLSLDIIYSLAVIGISQADFCNISNLEF